MNIQIFLYCNYLLYLKTLSEPPSQHFCFKVTALHGKYRERAACTSIKHHPSQKQVSLKYLCTCSHLHVHTQFCDVLYLVGLPFSSSGLYGLSPKQEQQTCVRSFNCVRYSQFCHLLKRNIGKQVFERHLL